MSLIQNWQLSDSYGMEIPGADKSTKERRFPTATPFNTTSLLSALFIRNKL
jgi:hypothetical protein